MMQECFSTIFSHMHVTSAILLCAVSTCDFNISETIELVLQNWYDFSYFPCKGNQCSGSVDDASCLHCYILF